MNNIVEIWVLANKCNQLSIIHDEDNFDIKDIYDISEIGGIFSGFVGRNFLISINGDSKYRITNVSQIGDLR